MAAGSRQSPVNIETDRAESDHEALSSKPLRWKYPATASRKLVNPGYCWRVDTDGEGTCELWFKISLLSAKTIWFMMRFLLIVVGIDTYVCVNFALKTLLTYLVTIRHKMNKLHKYRASCAFTPCLIMYTNGKNSFPIVYARSYISRCGGRTEITVGTLNCRS